jgi:hypothetical protein
MEQVLTMRTRQSNHRHAEAFCHMTYESADPRKYIKLRIWNSRDGVTPFCMYSKEFGVQLQHSHWASDVCDPTYKPKKGDLIWKTYTEKEAEDSARRTLQRWKEETAEMEVMTDSEFFEKYRWDGRRDQIEHLGGVLKDEERFVKETIDRLATQGQPLLELVKEDWAPPAPKQPPTEDPGFLGFIADPDIDREGTWPVDKGGPNV